MGWTVYVRVLGETESGELDQLRAALDVLRNDYLVLPGSEPLSVVTEDVARAQYAEAWGLGRLAASGRSKIQSSLNPFLSLVSVHAAARRAAQILPSGVRVEVGHDHGEFVDARSLSRARLHLYTIGAAALTPFWLLVLLVIRLATRN